MVLLRSFDNAWLYATLFPETGRVRVIPVWRSIWWKGRPVCGWYKKLGQHISAIFYREQGLHLLLGDRIIPFDDDTIAELQIKNGITTLSASHHSIGLSVSYTRPPPPLPPKWDAITFGVDENDVDFGCFVITLACDPQRRRRVEENFKKDVSV